MGTNQLGAVKSGIVARDEELEALQGEVRGKSAELSSVKMTLEDIKGDIKGVESKMQAFESRTARDAEGKAKLGIIHEIKANLSSVKEKISNVVDGGNNGNSIQ